MKKKLLMLLCLLMLCAGQTSATVWPRTYGSWSRLANGGTVSGTIKVPVIFVNFSQANSDDDNVITEANQTTWINNLNASTGYGANKYFSDMSYGNVNVEFVKVGTYTANNKASNWAGNNRATLAANAIQNATYATGFSKASWENFDSNSDDFVDLVMLIFAGHADGDNRSTGTSVSSINPHSSFVDSGSGTTYTGISKMFSRYVLVNELGHNSGSCANLGTALHELGHAIFDLPDYYGGSYVSYMGFWDTMDYGTFFGDVISTSNPVPGLSAFSRMLNGWLTPTELTYGQHVTIHPINDQAEAYMIKESDTHYYLFEARAAKAGSWDAGLTSGLILTEVNESDGGSWIIDHTTNDGKVKVVRADKIEWTSSNYSSNINTQPFGPNVKVIDSSYGSIFATKTVENIVVNADGTVEFDFMGGDSNNKSTDDLTDGTIVEVSNYYGLGSLVNDGGTIKSIGGSQTFVDRYFTDGRNYNTAYSGSFDANNADHLWQVMTYNGQKYLVNVGSEKTLSVANPTVLADDPVVVSIASIANLNNAFTLSSSEGNMSASVFSNIPTYIQETVLASNYKPNGSTFSYSGAFSSSKVLRVEMDLSTCTDANENVITIGENIGAWFGKHIHMYYTKSSGSLEVDIMNASALTHQINRTVTGQLVIELSSAGLTINGMTYMPADYSALSDIIALSTIYAGSQEGTNRSHAQNYNIGIGRMDKVNSAYPVSAIATEDASTAWTFRTVTTTVPALSFEDVFGEITYEVAMAKKLVAEETTVSKTVYNASTAALTQGADTEFLILSSNGWRGLGGTTTAVAIQDANHPTFKDDVNTNGSLYTLKWTSEGYLYNVGLQKYLNATANSWSYEDTGSTVWSISGTGNATTFSFGITGKNNKTTIYYLKCESEFTVTTSNSTLSLYTPSTVEEPGIAYVDAAPLAFSIKAEYATLYSADAYKIPGDDLVGYFIKDATASGGELTPVERYKSGDIVPAGTALLLSGTQGNYSATLYEAKAGGTETATVYSDAAANQLEGTRDGSKTASQHSDVLYYKLTWKDATDHDAGIGFYWGADNGEAFELTNSYTAYLAVSQASGVRGFSLPMNTDEETAIETVANGKAEESTAIYTLHGMRVQNTHNLPAGIYVRGGKKFVIR